MDVSTCQPIPGEILTVSNVEAQLGQIQVIIATLRGAADKAHPLAAIMYTLNAEAAQRRLDDLKRLHTVLQN
jgi:hypothetical protein